MAYRRLAGRKSALTPEQACLHGSTVNSLRHRMHSHVSLNSVKGR